MGLPSLSFTTFFFSPPPGLLDRLPSLPSFPFFFSLSSSSSSLDFCFLSCMASEKVILSWPGLASAAPRPSAVIPTMPSPTTRKMSAAGTKAHSSGASAVSSGFAGGSAVKRFRWRAQSPSPLAHSVMSFQRAAAIIRTSLSPAPTKLSIPRGSTFRILSRHKVAQVDVRLPSSSSHMLPRRVFVPGSLASGVHTRSFIFSRRSRQSPISGYCIITVCQFPRTQSLFLLASARVARFIAQRNCAR
mmetsp:Transcript_102479/g.244322  ORF Transcript_102479/g.244322 Transcript_102479/m.244322 type:complete len:245 (+) Transcript_102479:221-955(+)